MLLMKKPSTIEIWLLMILYACKQFKIFRIFTKTALNLTTHASENNDERVKYFMVLSKENSTAPSQKSTQ